MSHWDDTDHESKMLAFAEQWQAEAAVADDLSQREWANIRWLRFMAEEMVEKRMAMEPKETDMRDEGTTPPDHRTPAGKERYEMMGVLAEIKQRARRLQRAAGYMSRSIGSPGSQLLSAMNATGLLDAWAAMRDCQDRHAARMEKLAQEEQRKP